MLTKPTMENKRAFTLRNKFKMQNNDKITGCLEIYKNF